MGSSDDTGGTRRGRVGLFLPFILVLTALGAWTVWWFLVAQRLEQGLDRSAGDLRRAGYEVSWSGRSVQGWPFRTFLRFDEFRIRAPSGHALRAPRLQAEANTYDLDRWVVAAPDGLVVTRGEKGDLAITGEAIRASLSGLGRTTPRLVIEFRKPVFAPAAGAEPFPLTSADLVAFNLRPSAAAADAGDFLFRVEGGKPRPDGMLEWIGRGQPFATRWAGVLTEVDAFRGDSWSAAGRNWSRAGGGLQALRGEASTGLASARASAGRLVAGADGRLRGSVALRVRGGPESLLAMGRANALDPRAAGAAAAATAGAGGLEGEARIRLDFTDEGARIGPLRLSASPQVF